MIASSKSLKKPQRRTSACKLCPQSSRISLTPRSPEKIDETITIDSTLEVINASCEDDSSSFKWIQTPLKSKRKLPSTIAATSPKTRSNTNANEESQKSTNLLGPSKQRNVENWLASHKDTAVTTPPFALSPQERKKPEGGSNSSIDPEVKDVLVAIYGADWKKKRSKTEKKKNPPLKKATATSPRGAGKLGSAPFVQSQSVPNSKRNGVQSGKKSTSKAEGTEKKKTRIARRKIFSDEEDEIMEADSIEPIANASPDLIPLSTLLSTRKTRKRLFSFNDSSPNIEASKDTRTPATNAPQSVFTTPNQPRITKETPVMRRLRTEGVSSCGKFTPKRSFLASLSVSSPSSVSHPEAQAYKINFATKKDELCARLVKLYNSEVFGNGLPNDIEVKWNPKMRGTAGYCYNKRITRGTEVTRSARIELATRVVDRADRMRDTLAHELCHAATWVIDGVKDGHGPVWLRWAARLTERFPEIPPIKRCHNYKIATKYTYRCTLCSYSINRQSKSIDLDRKRCGLCRGPFELLVNKKKRGKTEVPEFDTTRTIKPPNAFALFVKEHYSRLKRSCPEKKHGELMKLLGQQYSIYKSVVTPGKK